MIILQTAGGGGAGLLGPGAGVLEGGLGRSTTFRDNDYIHRLNRALQAEMRAVSAWGRVASGKTRGAAELDGEHWRHEASAVAEEHQRAGRELVRLIVANRGIPEDKTALPIAVAPAVVGLLRAMPAAVAAPAERRTLALVEARLAQGYQRLLREAPTADRLALAALLDGTQRRRARLSK
jgi:hypothetical protein